MALALLFARVKIIRILSGATSNCLANSASVYPNMYLPSRTNQSRAESPSFSLLIFALRSITSNRFLFVFRHRERLPIGIPPAKQIYLNAFSSPSQYTQP